MVIYPECVCESTPSIGKDHFLEWFLHSTFSLSSYMGESGQEFKLYTAYTLRRNRRTG